MAAGNRKRVANRVIHREARKAIGWVEIDGKLKGHCVLVAPAIAVTCAHVISEEAEKPNSPVTVHFPNLGFKSSATVSGWSPYDPGLADGTDIAVLRLHTRTPDSTCCRLELERPDEGAAVVALNFQIARSDGDASEGRVTDGWGDVISLSGEHFVEEGMSGTGLFHKKVADRLVGLVSGRPLKRGQTTGYAIPADAVHKLLNERDAGADEPEALRLAFDTDEERSRFANRRIAGFDLYAPSQMADPGRGVALQLTLSFDRDGTESPMLTEVELHLDPVSQAAGRCGTGAPADIAGVRVQAMGTWRHPYWRISAGDGAVLDGSIEMSSPPLCLLPDAAAGDVLTARLTVFLDRLDTPDLETAPLSQQKKKIIKRLRLKCLPDPSPDGDLLLGEVSGRVREVNK
jgi:hypothetical protein